MTSGRKRLREWIQRSRLKTDKEAARILGVHPVVLSEWLSEYRGRRPGLVNALKIERVTGIPAESWTLTDVSQRGGKDSDLNDNA